jgi:hypothetical protein
MGVVVPNVGPNVGPNAGAFAGANVGAFAWANAGAFAWANAGTNAIRPYGVGLGWVGLGLYVPIGTVLNNPSTTPWVRRPPLAIIRWLRT